MSDLTPFRESYPIPRPPISPVEAPSYDLTRPKASAPRRDVTEGVQDPAVSDFTAPPTRGAKAQHEASAAQEPDKTVEGVNTVVPRAVGSVAMPEPIAANLEPSAEPKKEPEKPAEPTPSVPVEEPRQPTEELQPQSPQQETRNPDKPPPEGPTLPPEIDHSTSAAAPEIADPAWCDTTAEVVPVRSREWPPFRKEYKLFGVYREPLDPAKHPDMVASRRQVTFDGEMPKTNDERKILARVHEAATVVGDRLGIDVRHRIPDEDRYHPFGEYEQYLQAKQIEYDDTTRSLGLYRPDAGVLYISDLATVKKCATLAHELWHELDMEQAYIYETSGALVIDGKVIPPLIIGGGYNLASRGMNEAVKDMLTTETIGLLGFKNVILSYHYHDILLDLAIRETAHRAHQPPQEIADIIMRGSLLGVDGFHVLRAYLGDEAMSTLYRLKGFEMRDHVHRVALQLELPHAERLLKRYPRVFDWES